MRNTAGFVQAVIWFWLEAVLIRRVNLLCTWGISYKSFH